ncbi:hypothetical protein DL238_04700 [Alteriqipengyuania lutimaris]|uniref:Uncharacterized protein n=1 Tax=Alteriqipengyuania lutimaris TaxID=1538146 RepID=A0A395LP86_9SPHN|nr:hypothetical protein DL238_04700 [Alteriqipengyuania lutimaris]
MNDDAPIQKQGTSKWLWVAVIVVLAIAAVIVFLNADGEDPDLPDSAVTTQEERLDTDLTDESEVTDEALEDVNGVNQIDTVTPEGMDATDDAATDDDEPVVETQAE